MYIAFIAKMICDLSLWFSISGLVLSIFGELNSPIWYALIMVFSSATCRALSQKKLIIRLLPLISLIACIFYIKSILDALLIVPPMIYTVILNFGKRYHLEYTENKEYFKKAALVLLVLTFFVVMWGSSNVIEERMIIYVTAFLACGVLMLRQLRADEYMQRQWRLRFIDVVLLGGCLAAVLFVSSDFFIDALGNVLVAFNNAVIKPIIAFIGYILTIKKGEVSQFKTENINGEEFLERFNLNTTNPAIEQQPESGSTFDQVLVILAIPVTIIAAILIFRKILSQREKTERCGSGITELRHKIYSAAKIDPQKRNLLPPHDPRKRIRWYYQKILLMAVKKGVKITENYSSEQITEALSDIFEHAHLTKLRSIYIIARYSSDSINAENIREAKYLYKILRTGKTEETIKL